MSVQAVGMRSCIITQVSTGRCVYRSAEDDFSRSLPDAELDVRHEARERVHFSRHPEENAGGLVEGGFFPFDLHLIFVWFPGPVAGFWDIDRALIPLVFKDAKGIRAPALDVFASWCWAGEEDAEGGRLREGFFGVHDLHTPSITPR